MKHVLHNSLEITRPKIVVPPSVRPSPEEFARRRELAKKIFALREEIGPISISTAELIRQVREEEDGVAH